MYIHKQLRKYCIERKTGRNITWWVNLRSWDFGICFLDFVFLFLVPCSLFPCTFYLKAKPQRTAAFFYPINCNDKNCIQNLNNHAAKNRAVQQLTIRTNSTHTAVIHRARHQVAELKFAFTGRCGNPVLGASVLSVVYSYR